MSFFSWLQNLLKGKPAGEPKPLRPHGPDTTVDYPSLPATSTVHAAHDSADVAGRWKLRYGVVSTVGNVREHNEDSYFVPGRGAVMRTTGRSGDSTDEADRVIDIPAPQPPLFIVADGMGGQLAGEQASSMAVEHIPKELFNRLATEPDEERSTIRAIRDAVAYANQEILSLSSVETEYANMGTTVVMAVFRTDHVYVTGIGDSRAYRVREGQIERLTRDHSLADALGEAGTIAREEIPTHKFKNVLYLYLGSKDARGGPEDVRVMELREGDRFVLATDGLTGVVSDERLLEVVGGFDDPQRAAHTLVNEALQNLSKDNITCTVIFVEKC